MFKKLNPFYLIVIWLILAIVSTAICMIILGVSNPGGAQKPEIFLGKAVPVIVYGTLFIAVGSIPLYFKWIKKYWYVNLFFIIVSVMFIIKDF